MPPDDNTAQAPQPLSTKLEPPPVTPPPPPATPLPPQPAQPNVPPVQNPTPPIIQPTPNFAPPSPSGGKKKLFIILGLLLLLLLLVAGAVLAYVTTHPTSKMANNNASTSNSTAITESNFDAQSQELIAKARDCTPFKSVTTYDGPSPLSFGVEFQLTSKQSNEIKKGDGTQCILSSRYLEYSITVNVDSLEKYMKANPNFAKDQWFENMTAQQIATKMESDSQKDGELIKKSQNVCTFDNVQFLSDYLDKGYKFLKGDPAGGITTTPAGGKCIVNDI